VKIIDTDSLIEITVKESRQELRGIEYGRDVSVGVIPDDQRVLGSANDFGLVYDNIDLKYTKQVLKVQEQDPLNWGKFGVVVGREGTTDFYAILFEPRESVEEPDTIKFSKLILDLEDYSYEEEVLESVMVNNIEGFGLNVVKNIDNIEVYAKTGTDYDYPYDRILESTIPVTIYENVLGAIGWDVEVNSWLGKHRLKYGENSSYTDFELEWQRDKGMTGTVEYIPTSSEKMYYNSGMPIEIYLVPFRQDGIGNDMYGDLSLAFGGYIRDITEIGIPATDRYELHLEGNRYNLNREENIIILDDINEQDREITLRDYYTVLEDMYDMVLPVNSFSQGEEITLFPPILNVDGNLKSAEELFLLNADKYCRITPAEENISYDVDIYDEGEGVSIDVKHEDSSIIEEMENIGHSISIQKLVGKGEYYNKVVSNTNIKGDDWVIMRENRYDKFFGEELVGDISKKEDLPYSIDTLSQQSNLTEDFIDQQYLRYSAEIELVGSHHYLGGMEKQGAIRLYYPQKNFNGGEFLVNEFRINPDITVVKCSQAPRLEYQERIEELESQMRIEDITDIFTGLSKTRGEVFIDSIAEFDGNEEELVEVRLLDDLENPLTFWIEDFNQSMFRGYYYVDMRFKSIDLLLNYDANDKPEDSNPVSDFRRPKYVEIKNEEDVTYKYSIPNFYSHGCWLLPMRYYVTGSDPTTNELHIRGDVTDFYMRTGEVKIWGAGESDGIYEISTPLSNNIELGTDADGYTVTIITTDTDFDKDLDIGYADTGYMTTFYLTLGLQQTLITVKDFKDDRLILGHVRGALGTTGKLGHGYDVYFDQRPWSKNILEEQGIE